MLKLLMLTIIATFTLSLQAQIVNPLPRQKITDIQTLNLRNDTIFLKYGGFVKLPNATANNLGVSNQTLSDNRVIDGGIRYLRLNGKFGINKIPTVDLDVFGQMRVESTTLPAIFLKETGDGSLGPLIVFENAAQIYRLSMNYQNGLGLNNLVCRDQTAGSSIFEVTPGTGGIFYMNRVLNLTNKQIKNVDDGTLPGDGVNLSQVQTLISAAGIADNMGNHIMTQNVTTGGFAFTDAASFNETNFPDGVVEVQLKSDNTIRALLTPDLVGATKGTRSHTFEFFRGDTSIAIMHETANGGGGSALPNSRPDTSSVWVFNPDGSGNYQAASTTGWAAYQDDEFTSGSPFAVAGNTTVTLPNDAGTVNESQKPIDIATFYDSTDSTITGRDGDGLMWAIECKVVPSVASDYVEFSIDIGGAVGEIYPVQYSFPKGSGEVRPIVYTMSGYTLNTWQTNGGKVKIMSNGALDVYDIRYVLTRTHKAR